MTKIEELIESIRGKQTTNRPLLVHQDFQDFDIEDIMKEYAEFYAIQCLEIATNHIGADDDGILYCITYPDDIDLPPHQ